MTEPMPLTYLLLGSALVTLLTRVLASPNISATLDPKWKARIALLLGMAAGSITAALTGKGWVESITAGILVGAGSIGIYEIDKGRDRPLLATAAPPPKESPVAPPAPATWSYDVENGRDPALVVTPPHPATESPSKAAE